MERMEIIVVGKFKWEWWWGNLRNKVIRTEKKPKLSMKRPYGNDSGLNEK